MCNSISAAFAASTLLLASSIHANPTPGVYTVKDGNKVDAKTLQGWKTWRAMACERCHGAQQEGLVGPSLVNSLKTLSKEDFHITITNGRTDKGMPAFGGVATVLQNWENLYNYLKGRSDGKIAPGHLYPLNQVDAPPPPEGWHPAARNSHTTLRRPDWIVQYSLAGPLLSRTNIRQEDMPGVY